MRITLITNHHWPVLNHATGEHTGDYIIALLAEQLDGLGDDVSLIAPEGSFYPRNGRLLPMRSAAGNAFPTSQECEQEALDRYGDFLLSQDIVHDFSTTKTIAKALINKNHKGVICECFGGVVPEPHHNLVLQSQSQRTRAMKGLTDYDGTPTPDLAGPNGKPIPDAKVVYNGIDTTYYFPTYESSDSWLWLGRWHPVRGYREAINIAKLTGIKLILAGQHPDLERFDYQKECAWEARDLAKDSPNITIHYLSPDPNHHSDKRILFQQAKAYLSPVQFHEPFGLSQIEAMACATPIVTTNYGSMPEIQEHNRTGLVVNNTMDDLVSAVEQVEKRKITFNPRYIRDRATKLFDRRKMTLEFIKLYRDTLEQSGGWFVK